MLFSRGGPRVKGAYRDVHVGTIAVEVGLGGGFGGAARPQSNERKKGRLLGLDLDVVSDFPFFRCPVILPQRRRVIQWVTSYTTDLSSCAAVSKTEEK
ncbi:hypothetical protein YC2023_002453 [Brassica napus]